MSHFSTSFKDRMYLVKNGVPYDRVMAMETHELNAHIRVFGELEGNVWNEERGEWKRTDPMQISMRMAVDGEKLAGAMRDAMAATDKKVDFVSWKEDETKPAGFDERLTPMGKGGPAI